MLTSPPAAAHWLRPEEIVGGLNHDAAAAQHLGVVRAYRDRHLKRLLVITVDEKRWDASPAERRVQAAEEWLQLWRHNVAEGIVAVVDSQTQRALVHFDASGHAHVTASTAP
ncbi:MAG: hypothetical protein ABSA52_03335 [Candidatus Binatia bacterium]